MQLRLELILWIFRRLGFKITENLSLTIVVHNLYWFCSYPWGSQNIVRKVSINPSIHRAQENYINVLNSWCMAIGSDMVKLKSVCSDKDIRKSKFLKILCWPKQTPLQEFSAIWPPDYDPWGESKVHVLKTFFMTKNYHFKIIPKYSSL